MVLAIFIWTPSQGMVIICCPILAGDGVMNGLRGEHRQLLTPEQNLCLTRLFLPSKKNIDEFCFQGASKTSWTASRWQRKWCRSCSTQAVCREIGCFSTSYRFCFCVGLIGVLGFFPWKGGRVCKADQGRSQSSYQHGLLSWTLRWEVGRTLCTRHLGTLNVNCQMTTFGQSQTIGIFWRTHLQFHCQWVACFTLIVIFCFLFCFVLPKRCFKVCSLFDKLRRVCNSWEWNLLHTWARPISDRFTSLSYNIFVFFCSCLVPMIPMNLNILNHHTSKKKMTWSLIRTSRREHSGLQHRKRWKTSWKQLWQECRHWKVRCLLCNISRCMMEFLRRLGVSHVYLHILIF